MSDEDLNNLERKYLSGEKYGHDIQKEGLGIVTVCVQGRDIIAILKSNPDKLKYPDVQAWITQANATVPAAPPDNLKEIKFYALTMGTSTASGDAVCMATSPPGQFTGKVKLTINDSEELDRYLKAFSEKFKSEGDLVQFRKGAWDCFHAVTASNLVSASHLMRDILRKVIAKYATNEDVKASEWWAKPKDTEKDVVARHRLKLLIFGSKNNTNDAAASLIDDTVNICFEAYQRLNEVAHGSASFEEEVKKCLRVTEETFLAIFRYSERNSHRQ